MNQKLILSSNLLPIHRCLSYCRLKSLKTTVICNQIKNSYHSSNQLLNRDQTTTSEDKSTADEDKRTIYDSVKYTTSDAHLKHKAYQNFRSSDKEVDDIPVYERPIILISAAIFFIYFGYLREPNDFDRKMNSSLFELVPGLEIPLIETAISDAERVGNDTRQLRQRLNELKNLKQEVDRLEANKKS